MKTVFVRIPCRRFGVKVVLGPQGGLGELEQFLLRAIAAGSDTLEKLCAALQLDARVVLDATIDMLRTGLMYIEPACSKLELAPIVREEMGDPAKPNHDWTRHLGSTAPPEAREHQMFQELVGGGVIPAIRDGRSQPARLRAPEDEQLPLVRNIPKPVVLAAVARSLRSRLQRDAGSDSQAVRDLAMAVAHQRIVDLQVVDGPVVPGEADASRTMLVVEVARRTSHEDVAPDLLVVGPRSIPASIRVGIARGLVEAWQRGLARETDQFFGRLLSELEEMELGVAEHDIIGDPTWAFGEFTTTLDETTMAIDSGAGGPLEEVHQRLEMLERTAREEVDDAATHSARVTLLRGMAAQHDIVLRALKEARDQIVVTSPWVGRLNSDEPLRSALNDAVARGVRVHLLWGIDRRVRFEDLYGPAAKTLVSSLAPGNGIGGLYFSRSPSAVHAKLLICDFEWMLVSTGNFLNSPRERRELELALVVESPIPGEAPAGSGGFGRPVAARSLTNALRWARSLVPDYRLQSMLVDDPALGGRRVLTLPADLDVEFHAPDPLGHADLGRKVWLAEWRRLHQRLESRLKGAGTIVQPIADAQNRRILIDAIARVKRRLIVSSPELGAALLGSAVVPLIKMAVSKGVEVTIVSRRQDASETGQRRAELEELGVKFPNRNVHAKTIVCDDWTALSSFNFLSFEGCYDQAKLARHEFGVRVFDRELADAIAIEVLEAPLP
ncbi:MAG TPA: rhodopsin [Verrucomicrobiota bacterium]|nr:rhodopsin [Verrucomicrobiota bacterium]